MKQIIETIRCKKRLLAILSGIFLVIVLPANVLAQSGIVTEQDIKDAILERRLFTDAELQAMDMNSDGKVDVADLVWFLDDYEVIPSLTGEHIGIFYRDNANMIEGQSEVFGQIPFALRITSEDPLEGEIDNRDKKDTGEVNELGHYSLYFPKALIPVEIEVVEDGLNFEFEFKTSCSNLSPDNDLTRKMVFRGSFLKPDESNARSKSNPRLLAGTYEESVSGFKGNRGEDIPITLTGKFLLIFGSAGE
ncbi:MAG: hypothetical protein GY749_33795 [Desulfobacteraceae bacterium]|nr:hypothetical protein [Desulfobacteraceae bacterium]